MWLSPHDGPRFNDDRRRSRNADERLNQDGWRENRTAHRDYDDKSRRDEDPLE